EAFRRSRGQQRPTPEIHSSRRAGPGGPRGRFGFPRSGQNLADFLQEPLKLTGDQIRNASPFGGISLPFSTRRNVRSMLILASISMLPGISNSSYATFHW